MSYAKVLREMAEISYAISGLAPKSHKVKCSRPVPGSMMVLWRSLGGLARVSGGGLGALFEVPGDHQWSLIGDSRQPIKFCLNSSFRLCGLSISELRYESKIDICL